MLGFERFFIFLTLALLTLHHHLKPLPPQMHSHGAMIKVRHILSSFFTLHATKTVLYSPKNITRQQ